MLVQAGNKQHVENYRNTLAWQEVIICCNFVLIRALCGFLSGE